MKQSRFTPPILGIAALVALTVNLALTSCSKDEADARTPEVASVDSTAAATDDSTTSIPAVSAYAVSEREQIMFSEKGIIDVVDNHTDSPVWQLSYQEIAKRLDIDYSQISSIHITRDQILSSGLWRFDVRFDGQAKGSAYAIDVDPVDGEIEWTISLEEMPGGSVFVLHLN